MQPLQQVKVVAPQGVPFRCRFRKYICINTPPKLKHSKHSADQRKNSPWDAEAVLTLQVVPTRTCIFWQGCTTSKASCERPEDCPAEQTRNFRFQEETKCFSHDLMKQAYKTNCSIELSHETLQVLNAERTAGITWCRTYRRMFWHRSNLSRLGPRQKSCSCAEIERPVIVFVQLHTKQPNLSLPKY